jgi:hypothetical protein
MINNIYTDSSLSPFHIPTRPRRKHQRIHPPRLRLRVPLHQRNDWKLPVDERARTTRVKSVIKIYHPTPPQQKSKSFKKADEGRVGRTYTTKQSKNPTPIATLSGVAGPALPPPRPPLRFVKLDPDRSYVVDVAKIATAASIQISPLARIYTYDAIDGRGSDSDIDLGKRVSRPRVRRMPDMAWVC